MIVFGGKPCINQILIYTFTVGNRKLLIVITKTKNQMKHLLLSVLSAFVCISSMAQLNTGQTLPHVTMSNGTTVISTLKQEDNVLNVEVRNNDDEIEILIVEDGTVVNSESTIFEDDELQVELPMSTQPLDIYVRTKEETLYVGRVSKRE